MLRKLTTIALVWALAASAAFAQTAGVNPSNVQPQVGVSTAYLSRVTYSAVWIALVPAASATDVVCISGSSSKTIRIQQIKWTGTATTAINLPLTLLRRASLDTGGTAGSTTANPANTIGKRDLTNPTATATLISYTANPTINDTSPTYIDSAYLNIGTSATLSGPPLIFDYAKDTENFVQPPMIAAGSTAVQICVNFNASSIGAAGTTVGSITWTEE